MSFSNTTKTYDYENMLADQLKEYDYVNTIRMLNIVGYVIICALGLVLNPVAIAACFCYGCKSDAAKYILALSVTHSICSAFLPWQILYSWYHFNWHYGPVLCKVSSYVYYCSMFSTAGILTLWSVQCKGIKCFLFQNTPRVPTMIVCLWIFAAFLSIPSLYSRELQYTSLGEQCIDDFDLDDAKTTSYGRIIHSAVVWYRFLLGIVIPAFLIGVCGSCQYSRLERNLNKKTEFLIKMAYFVCWTPLLFMGLLQTVPKKIDSSYGLPIATVLAAAHCCINPVIFLLASPNHSLKSIMQTDQGSSGCI